MTPADAAALYLWVLGECDRSPADPLTLERVGRALSELVEIAGDELRHEPIEVE